MPNLNKVMLIGNLTREPDLKYTPKGTAICACALAVNRNYTTEGGEKREEVTFIDFEAYARLAEIIGEYCKKGQPIFIEGRLKLDSWDDKQSGQKRSKMKVVVETMQLLGSREGRGGGDHAPEGRQGGQQQQQRPTRGGPPARSGQTAAPGRYPNRPAADPDLDTAPDDIPF